jgi:cell division protease FtsH
MDDRRQTAQNQNAQFSRKIRPLLILLLIGLILVGRSWLSSPSVQQLPYSEFKAALRQGQIQKVQISKGRIRGTHLIPAEQSPNRSPDATGVRQPGRFVTLRVDDPDLIRELEAQQVSYSGQPEGGWFSILLWWLFPVALMVGLLRLLRQRTGGVQGMLNFRKSRARIYAEQEAGVTFTDVAGVEEAKEELQEIIDFLRQPQKYTVLGGRLPKGVLLVGPPGTGKTLLARAVAGEACVPFFSLSGSDFVEMFVGVGAARVRDLFKQAPDKAPAIVFIDGLDAVGKARGITPCSKMTSVSKR